jgi:2'-5' RNA ligase
LIAGRGDLRPVPDASLHATLVFLGWQQESDAERIAECAFEAARELAAARLEPAGVVAVPPRDPRLFALDLIDEADAVLAIQAACATALEQARYYRPEKRPFWPHITLARVKRGVRRAAQLEPERLPPPFEARRLTLYRSTLHPSGAIYDPLASDELSALDRSSEQRRRSP